MLEHSQTVLKMICGNFLITFSNLYLQKIACAKRFQNVSENFSRIFQACSQHVICEYSWSATKICIRKRLLLQNVFRTLWNISAVYSRHVLTMFHANIPEVKQKFVFAKDCLCETFSERFGIFQPYIPGMFSACSMRIFLKCNKNLYSQKIACAKRFQNVLEYFNRIFQACSQHIPSKTFPNKIVSSIILILWTRFSLVDSAIFAISNPRIWMRLDLMKRFWNVPRRVFQKCSKKFCVPIVVSNQIRGLKKPSIDVSCRLLDCSRHVPELFQARSENGSSRL